MTQEASLNEKITVRFGSKSYLIETLKATATQEDTDYIAVSQLCRTLADGYIDSLCQTDVGEADLTKPLPVLSHRGKFYVLDGVFAVAKAVRDQRHYLPCKILSIGDMADAIVSQSTDFFKLRYPGELS